MKVLNGLLWHAGKALTLRNLSFSMSVGTIMHHLLCDTDSIRLYFYDSYCFKT